MDDKLEDDKTGVSLPEGLPHSGDSPQALSKKIPLTYIAIGFSLLGCIAALALLLSTCSTPEVKTRQYFLAMDSNWYAVNLNRKEKNMSAFCKTLVQTIARNEGLKVIIDEVPSRVIMEKLHSDDYDGIISSLEPQQRFANHYLLSQPIYYLGPVLVVKLASQYRALEQMSGKRLGIMSDVKSGFYVENYPSIAFIFYKNLVEAFRELESNGIDGILMPTLSAHVYIQGFYFDKFKIATPPLTTSGIKVILKNGSKKHANNFITLFNRGLEKMRADGSYRQLVEAWDLVDTDWKKPSQEKD